MIELTAMDYESYINSVLWREKSRRIRKRDGYRCLICGTTDVPLEVHHLTYDRLGEELDSDLITVCHDCHKRITQSWHDAKDGIRAKRRYFALVSKYEYAREVVDYLNALTPLDISFGGKFVLTGYENIRKACDALGIDHKYLQHINGTFSAIHTFDVVSRLNNGCTRERLKREGYPKSLVDNIAKRKDKHEQDVQEMTDELICYMHEGKGKWTVMANEDGLDTQFRWGFIPYVRYGDRWWDT